MCVIGSAFVATGQVACFSEWQLEVMSAAGVCSPNSHHCDRNSGAPFPLSSSFLNRGSKATRTASSTILLPKSEK